MKFETEISKRKTVLVVSNFLVPSLLKMGYPTIEKGLYTGQPRKFKYKKVVSIESTTGQDSIGPSCSYILYSVYSTYDLLCFICVNK